MEKRYRETIKSMIIANDFLKGAIVDGGFVSYKDNRIINIELFFLTFNLFEEDFKKLEIYETWKELINNQDYYLDGDKVIYGGKEISFQLLEMTFLEVLLKYREKRPNKVLRFPVLKKDKKDIKEEEYLSNIKVVRFNVNANVSKYKKEDAEKKQKAIEVINTYELDRTSNTKAYLKSITNSFRDMTYDSILVLYNKLKEIRKDKMFNTNLELLDDNHQNNRFYVIFSCLLLDSYSVQFYGKDKDCVDYSRLFFPNMEVNANRYRYNNIGDKYEKRYEELNKILETCRMFMRNRKVKEAEKKRINFRIKELEDQIRRLDEEYICDFVEQTDVREVINDKGESVYTGSLINRNILLNLELAMKNGHVDIIKKHGKEKIVFYGIVGNDVDFIIDIDVRELLDVFDMDNVLYSISNRGKGKRTFKNN